jgi:hypothetical protein
MKLKDALNGIVNELVEIPTDCGKCLGVKGG